MGKRILNNVSYLIWGAFFVFLGIVIVALPGGTGAGIVLLLLGGWNLIGSIAEIRGVNLRQVQQLNIVKGITLVLAGLLLLAGAVGTGTFVTLAGLAGVLYGGWCIFSSFARLRAMGGGAK